MSSTLVQPYVVRITTYAVLKVCDILIKMKCFLLFFSSLFQICQIQMTTNTECWLQIHKNHFIAVKIKQTKTKTKIVAMRTWIRSSKLSSSCIFSFLCYSLFNTIDLTFVIQWSFWVFSLISSRVNDDICLIHSV